MIMPTNGDTLGGTAAMQNFGIEMNASMFSMLTKNVYSDTILAVMREWSTNAIDACVAADLPIKYEVALPTLLAPEFSVRDYGTGLSPEEVTGLFSMLGASTKRTSNKFNGTFGIGRMAGLAYTDSFIIESYLNGVKYSFAVSTDSGIPQMISLGEVETDEDNGVKLSIVTQTKDTSTFLEKAGYLYHYFEVKPICEQKIKYPECDKVLEGDDWYIENTTYGHRYNNTLLVIMGNVAYQVPSHELSGVDMGVSDVLNASVRLFAPLGSVSITPGREGLSMDEKTIKYIVNRLQKLKKEASAEFYKELDTLDEGWEKVSAFNKAINDLPRSIVAAIKPKLSPHEKKYFDFRGPYGKAIELKTPIAYPGLEFQVYGRGYVTARTFENLNITLDITHDPIHFVIADTRIGIKDCVAIYRKQLKDDWEKNNPGKYYGREPTIIVIKAAVWDKNNIDGFISTAEKLIEELGNPTYFLASDVHTPVRTSGSGPTRTATEFYPLLFTILYGGTDVQVQRSNLPIKSDEESIFYYIEMSSHEIKGFGHDKLSIYLRFLSLWRKQNPTSKKTYKVIGVPKNGMANIAKDPRFIPIEGALDHLAPDVKLVNTNKPAELFGKCRLYSNQTLKKLVAAGVPDDLGQYLTAIHEFESKYPFSDIAVNTLGIADTFKCSTIEPDIKWTYKDLVENYKLIPSMISRLELHEVAHYAHLEHYKRNHKRSENEN